MSGAGGEILYTKNTEVQAEILASEIVDADRPENFGFKTKPKTPTSGVFLFLNGDRGQPVCLVATDQNENRFLLESGEVIVYNDSDNYIKFNSDGEIEIKSDKIKIDGDLEVTGEIRLKNELVALNTHTHTSAAPGTQTSPPTTGT